MGNEVLDIFSEKRLERLAQSAKGRAYRAEAMTQSGNWFVWCVWLRSLRSLGALGAPQLNGASQFNGVNFDRWERRANVKRAGRP